MNEFRALPNIPRFYTALAEWLACISCLLEVRRRLKGWKFALTAAGTLLAQTVFLVLTKELDDLLWIICMTAAVVMMYGFIYLCAQLPWKDAAYYCIRSFVIAEFAASFEWECYCFCLQIYGKVSLLAEIGLLILVYGLIFIGCIRLYQPYRAEKEILNITERELISYGIIGFAVFLMSNWGFLPAKAMMGIHYPMEIYNARMLVDLGGVSIMYAYHVQRVELRMRHEYEVVQGILHNQYAQYKQAREAVDVINYKYHDLKHHIIALRAEESAEKRAEYLDQLEEELQDYETQNKTGNKILDIMLTTKNQYCKKHGITMTCVVDGTLFEFMKAMDLCSVFGNALDNAIQCVLKIPDKEKRMIHVSAYSQKSFLIIRFENYYEGEIRFSDDLPLTTKKNKEIHGYGLKSIRYTVQKYEGAVNISTQGQWFHLKILIPMQQVQN